MAARPRVVSPDIRYEAEWGAIVARMRSCAPDPHGAPRVIGIQVLVTSSGRPVAWSRPRVTVLEPKASALENLLTEFAD